MQGDWFASLNVSHELCKFADPVSRCNGTPVDDLHVREDKYGPEGWWPCLRQGMQVQRGFPDEHFARRVPKIVTDVLKSARADFYKGVAKIIRGYVEMDKKG